MSIFDKTAWPNPTSEKEVAIHNARVSISGAEDHLRGVYDHDPVVLAGMRELAKADMHFRRAQQAAYDQARKEEQA